MKQRPRIKALLIDLSGTLHIDSVQTSSAVTALQRLRDAKMPLRFCSNTSKESSTDLARRLRSIGFIVQDGELWTSLGALRSVLDMRGLRNPYFLLSQSALKEFPGSVCVEDLEEDANLQQFDSVVVGLAPEVLNYKHLTRAFRVLMVNGNPLVTTHNAKYVRTQDGELSLGPGPFVAALENATSSRSVETVSVGKPSKAFFERVLETLRTDVVGESAHISPPAVSGRVENWHDVAVIGDDIEADLGDGARQLGLWRVLVKTGKYQTGDEHRPGIHPPDETHESFSSFVDTLLEDNAR